MFSGDDLFLSIEDRRDRPFGFAEQTVDHLRDLLRRCTGLSGEILDLLCDHGEAASMLPGLSGDNCRVQREQTHLISQIFDHFEHLPDILGLSRQALDHLGGPG